MNASAPLWVQALVALLLVVSGMFSVLAALGLVRLKDYFLRMHPPALANTLAAWCVTLASIVYFSALESRPVLYPWVINILLAITAPVTTMLVARAALFRKRRAGENVPLPLRSDG